MNPISFKACTFNPLLIQDENHRLKPFGIDPVVFTASLHIEDGNIEKLFIVFIPVFGKYDAVLLLVEQIPGHLDEAIVYDAPALMHIAKNDGFERSFLAMCINAGASYTMASTSPDLRRAIKSSKDWVR